MSRLRLIVASIIAVATIGLTPAPAQADLTPDYRIWHWNIAGHAYHLGSTTDGIIDAMRGSISYRNPDFVSVNEICHGQYRALIYELREVGWTQSPTNFARFAELLPAGDPSICGGDAYGIALYSRFALGATDRIALTGGGEADDKQRMLLCAELQAYPAVKFCTTHLTYDSAHRATQLAEVRGVLDSHHDAGGTAIIAGDFNVQPDDPMLDSWYSSGVDTPVNGGNHGRYRELDDTDPICLGWGEQSTASAPGLGACGLPRKVDLVFARSERLIGYGEDTLPIGSVCGRNRDLPCSDHRIVDAYVEIRVLE